MKQLSKIECQDVSGGMAFTFFLSILSGATGGDRSKTVVYDGLWWGFCCGLAGLPYFIFGAVLAAPAGFCIGAVEGYLGHVIGSCFYTPPPTHAVLMPQ